MEVSISDGVIKIFPDIEVYGLIVKNIDQSLVSTLDFSCVHQLNSELFKNEIDKWNSVYNRFNKPKKARVSIKYLFESFSKGKLKNIHRIVDVYNYASLISACPIGGEDLYKIGSGTLELSIASGNESFTPFDSGKIETPLPGEVIWSINTQSVVCRSMNFIESNDYKISDETNAIIFIIEKPLPTMNGNPFEAFSFIKRMLCNTETNQIEFTLTANSPSFVV